MPATPLVIPALKNRDWREIARKRKTTQQYVPCSVASSTGEDGSVGGLGVRDKLNSGPSLSGLQIKRESSPVIKQDVHIKQEYLKAETNSLAVKKEEGEEERAIQAILLGVNGVSQDESVIDTIPLPISEAEAYKQDVEELPESSTLDDYARVPISQFGAAMLRGMGWKEGTPATRLPGKGLVEPYLPQARPALLGIGAKEQEIYDDGTKKGIKRPEKKYVPVVKMERDTTSSERVDRSRSPTSRNSSRTASRPSSRSKNRHDDYDDRSRTSRDYRRNDYDRDRNRSYRDERREDRDSRRRRG